MKKILLCLVLMLSTTSSIFAAESDIEIDKDNMQDLIEGSSSLRVGSDRAQLIYEFEDKVNMPMNLGISILDLTSLVDNYDRVGNGNRQFKFLPKLFVGLSFYDYAIAYQYNLDFSDTESGIEGISHSHTLSFGMSTSDFYFSTPVSFVAGRTDLFPGGSAFSLTPTFTFLFRGGIVSNATISAHYGVSFAKPTNDNSGKIPMSVGISLAGTIMFTDPDSTSFVMTMPLEVDFRYGISSSRADIDAGFADEVDRNVLYDNNGKISTDSIFFSVLVPYKVEARFGAIYTYGMPRVLAEIYLYQTDHEYSLSYGFEAGFELTPLQNFTVSLIGYTGGSTISRVQEDRQKLNHAFDADLDLWMLWRF